ncbi:hypothetical protein AAFF_G00097860 [Aldrovandia affinis]|uniref:Uncharacterized protein n=1 Tax=Aldrovandia affinis TaxID=143900 RepID=A0AAD7RVL7_9TELE|nr:hypothetical protein AAFF_G00097860 [Aldrovandia affinis]
MLSVFRFMYASNDEFATYLLLIVLPRMWLMSFPWALGALSVIMVLYSSSLPGNCSPWICAPHRLVCCLQCLAYSSLAGTPSSGTPEASISSVSSPELRCPPDPFQPIPYSWVEGTVVYLHRDLLAGGVTYSRMAWKIEYFRLS